MINKFSLYLIFLLSIYIICNTNAILSSSSLLDKEERTVSSKSNENRVKVLLIRNEDKQNLLEQAASLSLDYPKSDHLNSDGNRMSGNNHKTLQNDIQLENNDTSPSSSALNERPSLASLTLHQRDFKQTKRDLAQNNNDRQNIDDSSRLSFLKGNSTTAKQQQQQQQRQLRVPNQKDPWSELHLPRLKPTWLNVSSQYKITTNSIEEVEAVMPVEYLLRAAFDSPILLKTKLGILEGVRSIKFNKHLYTFLSVPYAQAPIGELRFKAPKPIDKWEGILQATKWPPFCVQPSMTLASKSSPVHVLTQFMSEDCLYLNIWTPSLKFNKNQRRPVMVWIHGGAFQYGGISVDENDGSALALLGNVVVVTLNYRISAFGFLNANNGQNGPNNVGLLDQRAALEWVHNNIKQFGGDPQQVTLFGESAGGHSVGLHMISPASFPYFKRAILQSGVPVSQLRAYDVNSDTKGSIMGDSISSIMMAKRLKCFVPTPEQEASEASLTTSAINETTSTDSPSDTTTGIEKEDEAAAITTTTTTTTTDTTTPESEPDYPLLSDETLDCLRNKSSLEILKAMGVPGSSGFFPTGNDRKGFFPDGFIADSYDPENLKVGPQKDYLFGINLDEGTFFLLHGMPSMFPPKSLPKVDTVDALKAGLAQEMERRSKIQVSTNASELMSASGSKGAGGPQAHLYKPLLRTSSSILENFMPKSQVRVLENGTVVGNTTSWSKPAEFGKNIGSLITDIIFLCPARALARTLSEAGRNVYFYLYTHRSSLSQYHEWLGVTHHDEVEFVFGRPLRLADVYSGKDIEMSQRMIKSWAHFAYTGQMMDQIGVKWPKYGDEDNNYMILNADKATTGQRYHDKVCNIYETVISVHLQDN